MFILLSVLAFSAIITFSYYQHRKGLRERLLKEEADKNKQLSELARYRKETYEKFIDAVIWFEANCPEDYRSVWYFLDRFSHSNENFFYFIHFDEWLDGCVYHGIWGIKDERGKDGLDRGNFDDMYIYYSSLIDRLPYPKYVLKDLDTVAMRSIDKDDLLKNNSDMVAFFDGELSDSYTFFWEMTAASREKIKNEQDKKIQARQAMIKKLG
jgi:hypothetical protein